MNFAMPESRKCSRCGAELAPDAPGGHCLPRLLQLGLQSDETSADEVAAGILPAVEPRSQPGARPGDERRDVAGFSAAPVGRMPSSTPGRRPATTRSPRRPYIVMELVRGVKITADCDQQKLSTRERLGLF